MLATYSIAEILGTAFATVAVGLILCIVSFTLAADRIADRENRKRQDESEPR